MSTVTSECLTCGKPLIVADSTMFANPTSVCTVCRECAAAELLEEGGLIKMGAQPTEGDLFGIGRIYISPGAVKALPTYANNRRSFSLATFEATGERVVLCEDHCHPGGNRGWSLRHRSRGQACQDRHRVPARHGP